MRASHARIHANRSPWPLTRRIRNMSYLVRDFNISPLDRQRHCQAR
jgi:hypothetical protein